jgi:hypothetical protein
MVQAEIVLCVMLAAAGAFLLLGLLRGLGRRGPGPGGMPARLISPVRSTPDGAASVQCATPVAPMAVTRRPPANPLPMVPRPADPPPVARSGVNNSRFARFDRSGRPASMGSPYLRAQGPAAR